MRFKHAALRAPGSAAYINDMTESTPKPEPAPQASPAAPRTPAPPPEPEVGGPRGPEPTRYGDWERGGRCIDF